MVSTLTSLSALLTGFALLCLGHGLNNTLLGVRSVHENFADWTIALMTSAYFAGFIVGTRICTIVLSQVGHIRCFATFASIASAVSIAYLLLLNEAGWIGMRFLYGLCMAANYVTLESWLNALATRRNRGSVMSVYMMVNFLALAAGQWLLLLGQAESHELFLVVSILVSLALVPVSVSKRQAPSIGETMHTDFALLRGMNRAAVIGIIGLGIALGSYWGLGAAYLSRVGMSSADIARFLSAGFLGGLLFQWPLGYLSDRLDRRLVISATLVMAICASTGIGLAMLAGQANVTTGLFVLAFLYGGSCYTLYSLFMALANDFLEADQLVAACAGMIMLHAGGALAGPFLIALFTPAIGPAALFLVSGAVYVGMLLLTGRDYLAQRTMPEATHAHFAAMPRTGPVAAEMGLQEATQPREDSEASSATESEAGDSARTGRAP